MSRFEFLYCSHLLSFFGVVETRERRPQQAKCGGAYANGMCGRTRVALLSLSFSLSLGGVLTEELVSVVSRTDDGYVGV